MKVNHKPTQLRFLMASRVEAKQLQSRIADDKIIPILARNSFTLTLSFYSNN